MNRVDKKEMFAHVKQFLKAKGIDLQEGSYTQRIQQGCGILTDTINLSQQAYERTRTALDKGLERAREVIHEKTAPRPTAASPRPGPRPTPGAGSRATGRSGSARTSARKSTRAKTKRPARRK